MKLIALALRTSATYSRSVTTFVCLISLAGIAAAQITVTGFDSVSASVSNNGSWTVAVPAQGWNFAGTVGVGLSASRVNTGTDNLGTYEEAAFSYTVAKSSRSAAIRVYSGRPLVLFNTTYNNASTNTAPFPTISSYPALSHLSFNGEFAGPDFTDLLPDSPWVFYDGSLNTWILSPAANYMTAAMTLNGSSIGAGIDTQIGNLPAGFSHSTALVFGGGINNTFTTWGQAITDIGAKTRPANNADTLLKNISYWTDNGATYYYNPGDVSYMATLDAIRAEFDAIGIKLGSLQLDSWWYPKGPDNTWSDHNGIWTYTAAPDLFVPDLATFQAGLKAPLITHARWIDAASPYRNQYTISGNVATDPKYWEDIGTYLQNAGTAVYEQDWLGDNAHADFNLTDPYAFLGNMAASMARRGIDIQYCMAEPKHFLQSSTYSNVTSIRTSQDRFVAARWTPFFYSSRFASAVGVWPFADVFMSGETGNMIASLISAGPVGVGDPIGGLSKANLAKAARSDGMLVKPDVSATPMDSVFVNDALGIDVPMVASSWSDFGNGIRAHYIFAYARATNTSLTISPATFGIAGASYLYEYLSGAGTYIGPGGAWTTTLTGNFNYYVLVPVTASGIALVGDKGNFVTLGKQRIPTLSDNGVVDVTVSFAPGEMSRTLFGYSSQPVSVSSISGTHKSPAWNEAGQLFSVVVHPSAAGTAHLQISTTVVGKTSGPE